MFFLPLGDQRFHRRKPICPTSGDADATDENACKGWIDQFEIDCLVCDPRPRRRRARSIPQSPRHPGADAARRNSGEEALRSRGPDAPEPVCEGCSNLRRIRGHRREGGDQRVVALSAIGPVRIGVRRFPSATFLLNRPPNRITPNPARIHKTPARPLSRLPPPRRRSSLSIYTKEKPLR